MHNRFRTLISLISITTAVAIAGGVAISQLRQPVTADGRSPLALAASATAPAPAFSLDTFRDIARGVSAGVVNINTEKVVKRPAIPDPFREFFGDGWSGPQGGGAERQKLTSLGSGFVIDKDGFILTNRHVVDGADEIKVTFPNQKTYEAKLVGKDARTDVALIKIEAKENLTVLPLGDSATAEVGEWVMAIGSPFNMHGTVTVGVVSFAGRALPLQEPRTSEVQMIQTDAAINPGNSGGPLLNTRGEVIGINTLIVTQGVGQSAGVGFAVPINVAKQILPQLKEKGSVTRGWIGVAIGDVTEALAPTFGLKKAAGAVVGDVTADGPADKAGVHPEDVILAVDGKAIQDSAELVDYISSRPPGTVVKLRVLRAGAEKVLTVTLGTFPETESDERAEGKRGAHLGMDYRELTAGLANQLGLPPGSRGVLVMSVEPSEAADDAGLAQRDVIVSVNSRAVETVESFEAAMAEAKPAGSARLRVRRGNATFLAVIKLE